MGEAESPGAVSSTGSSYQTPGLQNVFTCSIFFKTWFNKSSTSLWLFAQSSVTKGLRWRLQPGGWDPFSLPM